MAYAITLFAALAHGSPLTLSDSSPTPLNLTAPCCTVTAIRTLHRGLGLWQDQFEQFLRGASVGHARRLQIQALELQWHYLQMQSWILQGGDPLEVAQGAEHTSLDVLLMVQRRLDFAFCSRQQQFLAALGQRAARDLTHAMCYPCNNACPQAAGDLARLYMNATQRLLHQQQLMSAPQLLQHQFTFHQLLALRHELRFGQCLPPTAGQQARGE